MAESRPRNRLHGTVALLVVWSLAGCDQTVIDVPRVASIEVTSPINTIITVDWETQLSAAARDAQGRELIREFTWTSSNPDAVTVNTNGVVRGIAIGEATIRAEAEDRSGSLPIRVVDADLNATADVLADPLRAHLVSHLPGARAAVEEALGAADQALAAGNIVALNEALTAVNTEAASATDPDDRAILGTLVLLTDFAVRMLGL